MNLGQNKLFVGIGAALLVVFIALLWFLYQASSDFSAADATYQEQVTKLQRLQNLPLYPETSNLQVLEEQKKIAAESAVRLHKELVPMAFPLEAMTPEQFQDALNASVKTLVDKAAKAGVKLSDKFYLGFSEYRTTTPRPEAAAVLGRQLKCIELAVDTLIEKKVSFIGEITRPHLPEEDKGKVTATQPTPKPAGAAKKAPELLFKYPFEIQFLAEERAFQSALNELSKNTKQFFIISPLAIKNENPKAPKKIEKVSRSAVADPNANSAPEKLLYVLGAEKLNVTLHFDSVVFAGTLPK